VSNPADIFTWNRNGKIDPTDIAISLATDGEDEEEDGEEFNLEDKHKPRTGCLTSAVSIVGIIVFAAFMLINRL
jgi:hypothetical protein